MSNLLTKDSTITVITTPPAGAVVAESVEYLPEFVGPGYQPNPAIVRFFTQYRISSAANPYAESQVVYAAGSLPTGAGQFAFAALEIRYCVKKRTMAGFG